MSDTSTPPATEPAGHGHTVSIKLPDGRSREVPWGFTDAKKESAAAKKHGIELPGTTAEQ